MRRAVLVDGFNHLCFAVYYVENKLAVFAEHRGVRLALQMSQPVWPMGKVYWQVQPKAWKCKVPSLLLEFKMQKYLDLVAWHKVWKDALI